MFSISFKVNYRGDKQVLIPFKKVIMSFFRNSKLILPEFTSCETKQVLTHILDLILSINQDYIDNGSKKIRKYRFIQKEVYEITLEENKKEKSIQVQEDERIQAQALINEKKVNSWLNELKMTFITEFFNVPNKSNTSHYERKDDHGKFFSFSDMVIQFNKMINSISLKAEFLKESTQTVENMVEMLFIKEFDARFSFSLSLLEERETFIRGSFEVSYLDIVIKKLKTQFNTLIDVTNNHNSLDNTSPSPELPKNNKTELENFSKEKVSTIKAENTMNQLSLFSCEMFNKKLVNGYNKKIFYPQPNMSLHSEFYFN